MKGYIYKITSPTGRIYIGQTINISGRYSSYKNLNCKQQPKIYRSIVKYGWENHKFDIIYECEFCGLDNRVLNELETFWIKEYNSMYEGLNCTEGGGSRIVSEESNKKKGRKGNLHYNFGKKSKLRNIPRKQETKDKISMSKKGHLVCEEVRYKISNSLKGKPGIKHTQETKDKISKSSKGKTITKEVRDKISNSLKGRKPLNGCKINVYVYKSDEYVGTYNSYVECAKQLNIGGSHISDVINGKRKHVSGYTFKRVT